MNKPIYVNSNMTPEEEFAQFGTLSAKTIEMLLSTHAAAYSGCGITPHIEEAMAQYPAEDALGSIIKLLSNLHGNLRKSETKDAVKYILDQAEDLQLGMGREAEYGRDELRQALEAIEAIEAA